MRTSEDVHELGLYASDCCGQERIFHKSDCFCRCPKCQRLCEWELVESLISWNQMERQEERAA